MGEVDNGWGLCEVEDAGEGVARRVTPGKDLNESRKSTATGLLIEIKKH